MISWMTPPARCTDASFGPRQLLAAFVAFFSIGLVVYGPALSGSFISDDSLFLVDNPYVKGEGGASVAELWRPGSDAQFYSGGSYQPVTQTFHALEWRLFGRDTRYYHVVNLALHAVDTTLLVWLLCASAVPLRAALLAGALFAFHPANVEVVAWISQSRSLLALGFALAALLALERRALASVPLFALALLSKGIAAFAIPMGAALLWAHRERGRSRAPIAALALWVVLFLAFAPLEMTGLSTLKPPDAQPYGDFATQLRSIAAYGAHYLWMATSGTGLSAFHEPAPVRSWLDGWSLGGLALAPFFLWRIASGLLARRAEAAWWIGAAAAFVPISQIAPFFFPMADRYLYFILPGLIGGSVIAGSAALARFGAAGAPRVVAAACAVWIALLAVHTYTRSFLWQSEDKLIREAAQHYPDGMIGHYVAAIEALELGRYEQAISDLRASMTRGAYVVRSFANDPALADLKTNPQFRKLALEMEGRRIAFARGLGARDQFSLRSIASGHYARGELDLAIAALEEALARGGPLQAELEEVAAKLRRERDAAQP